MTMDMFRHDISIRVCNIGRNCLPFWSIWVQPVLFCFLVRSLFLCVMFCKSLSVLLSFSLLSVLSLIYGF